MNTMDSNGLEITTPVGSEDTASLASYYDNAGSYRSSRSYEDQSDESDSDHEVDDHEADIDKMLMDLEDFQVVRHPISFYQCVQFHNNSPNFFVNCILNNVLYYYVITR